MLNMAVLAKSYHRRGKPVVLLPQMLGPFDTAPSQEAFVQLAKYCSRIYARDNTSFQNAAALIDDSILSLSPDVTIASVSNKPIDETKGKTEQVCMVPNQRVLDSGETPWSEDDYLNFFCQSAKQIIAAGKDISVVVHDRGGEDIKLAHSLLNKLDSPNASLFTADNPIELKRHISQSRFLIGSRFHSIVAALSSDIPAIALGWAHKYTELLTDYGQEKYDLKSYQEMENAPGLICEMLDDERLAKNKSCISDRNKMLQKQISTMWSEVATILGLQPS
jgi:colanic acid/amylovoran biosynthesis protein